MSLDGVDEFRLNGASVSDPRVFRMLEEIRARAGVTTPVRIESHNYVPTASGLASSASGSAALGGALWAFFTGSHEPEEISDLIRIGSGSAPRSLVGGLVELNRETTSVTQLSPTRTLGLGHGRSPGNRRSKGNIVQRWNVTL